MPLLQTHAPSHSIVGDGVSGRSVRLGGRARRNVVTLVVGLFVLAFTILVLGTYYDQYWWPANEGHYAHRAERILDGDVLNRDVQDIRPGAVTFFNALIFRAFGEDLISLRYPLALAAIVQAMLIFFVVSPRGPLVAAAAAMSLTALSFIQFLNPAAHWYALFLLIVIIGALDWIPPDRRGRLELIGFLVMTLLLFRQLTGIFAAMGVLTYLLCEAERAAAPRGRVLGGGTIVVMAAGLLYYLLSKGDILTLALFGVWPLCLFVRALFVAPDNSTVAKIIVRLTVGAAVPATPLVVYHLLHGSMAAWYSDVVIHAIGLTNLDLFDKTSYGVYLLGGLLQILKHETATKAVNGTYWLLLPLVPAVQGLLAIRSFAGADSDRPALHPLPFLAVFYALVSVHYQHHHFLYYTVGLSMAALLWSMASGSALRSLTTIVVALTISSIGIYYHAAQPASRTLAQILAGERTAAPVPSQGLERSSLRIQAADRKLYVDLIGLIQREVPPAGTIFVLPASPELYFLSERRNPFRFFNTGIGVNNEEDVEAVLKTLTEAPPRLVIFNLHDGTLNRRSEEIMEFVRQRYRLLKTSEPFEIYQHRGDPLDSDS